jgi:hypothetical protein
MTDTPRTDAIEFRHCPPQPKELLKKHQDAYALSRELERELAEAQAEVERLRDALKSCFWATNTYDGNYTRACDNVAMIAVNALKTQDKELISLTPDKNHQ